MTESRVSLEDTQREFSLQAPAMERGATFNATGAIEPFLRLLGSPLPRPVLDLACGPGILSASIAQAGGDVVGLDATPAMLEHARRRCRDLELRAEFRQGDAASLPFEDAHFAAAVTRLSLHHFPQPSRVLAESRRVLRPGGTLVVGDIVASRDAGAARLHNAIEILRDPSHCRFFDEVELGEALEAAGFRVEHTEAWTNPKSFEEWAAVVEEARSMEAVHEVMRALARSGADAGINLHFDGDQLRFDHHWRFVRALAI